MKQLIVLNRRRKGSIIALCIVIFFAYLFMSTRGKTDGRQIFDSNKKSFDKVVSIADSIISLFPGCYSFRFLITSKYMYQVCDSVKPNVVKLPGEYLATQDEGFIREFMRECHINIIKVKDGRVEFIFDDSEPGRIIYSRFKYGDFKENSIGGKYLFFTDKEYNSN